MQEDEYNNYFFPKFKSLGYYCLFKKRTGDKPDGCSIIFKVRLFKAFFRC
jgi:protein angel